MEVPDDITSKDSLLVQNSCKISKSNTKEGWLRVLVNGLAIVGAKQDFCSGERHKFHAKCGRDAAAGIFGAAMRGERGGRMFVPTR